LYAIVDIETTGSYAAANGITEICIQIFDGEKVIERFDSLVNPLQSISPYIQAMTGITNEMVVSAPTFDEIAHRVYELLQDNIFVAHNVNFDYSFVRSQLQYAGYQYDAQRLCTVRLSRKIFPGFQSYSLGRLCQSLQIRHQNQHRAGGDTDATVILFKKLLENDKDGLIDKSLKRASKEQVLPPNVPKTDFDKLPYTAGIYYFHDEKGNVVYVGKAKNIRYRVSSHFSNNSSGRQRQNFLRYVYSISYEECGTELMAAIKESSEIKRLWPRFNASQKKKEDLYAIISYEDRSGYLRLAVDKVKRGADILGSYHHIENAKAALRQLVTDFSLCPKMCFLNEELFEEKGHQSVCRGACTGQEAASDYNLRVLEAIEQLKNQPSFAIIDKGVDPEEKSCILVWKGRFYGMGFIGSDIQIEDAASFKDYVIPHKENSAITNMLFNYAKRYPQKVLMLRQ
jgi:DNA polymerase-3 subunit epsilon